MQRRHLLQRLGAASLAPLALYGSRSWATPGAGRSKFLLVFLRGGYDAANLLVPTANTFYEESRPNIAIARPGRPQGALALDAQWGLHPALATSVLPLYQRGQVAFVPFCGTDDLTRSHFETQDSIELGQGVGERRDFRSGFLNRLCAELGGAEGQGIAFTDQLPMALRGPVPVANVALSSVGKAAVDDRQARIIEAMYGGGSLATPVREGFQVQAEARQSLQAEMESANRRAMSARGFEQVARRMAFLLQSEHDIGFVDVGGWDTHVAQGGASGALASRFEELGQGLAALADGLGEAWGRTTVVVISEFGRTFRENGNRGTDHGHGSVLWVLGGGVRGGRVLGEQVVISPSNLFQNRDFPVLNDYRSVLAGLLGRQYGLGPQALQRIFPGAPVRDLGLV